MDAISLLKADHDKVKKMLADGEETTERAEVGRTELFAKLKEEMLIHERIEEEIFYPALQKLPKAREDVLEAFEEHHLVDELVTEIDVETDDEKWKAKFTVMRENIEHHIKDEEEKLFPKAAQLLGEGTLGALGVRMADLKEAEQDALAEELDEEEEERETTSSG